MTPKSERETIKGQATMEKKKNEKEKWRNAKDVSSFQDSGWNKDALEM